MPYQHRNLLIQSLPAEERHNLIGQCEAVLLPAMTVLHEPEISVQYAYFLTSGIASVLTYSAEGVSVEVGLIGREGLTAGFSLLGPEPGLTRCIMQMPGTALRIPMIHLRVLFRSSAKIRDCILEFIQHEAMTLAQLTACNRLHSVDQRLARLLLMLQDRSAQDELLVTQEFMAERLGSRRSAVTVAAGGLQRSGAIAYSRGHLRILDRDQLQSLACGCYRVVQQLDRNSEQRRAKPQSWFAPSAA